MLRTLYNDPDRYVQTYFSRFGPRTYFAGDGARRDEDGYFWITGRVDDVINVSGHRLSTAEIESALVSHPAVAEAAVIATADDLTGQSVRGLRHPGLRRRARARPGGRRCASTSAAGSASWPGRAGSSGPSDLPKTRSGKIMRRLLRDVAEGREPGDVTTLRDASVLAQLQQAVTAGDHH